MKLFRPIVIALSLSALAPGTALADPPGATTTAATDVTSTTATLNGLVNPNKEDTTYHFEYGTTTGYGSVTPDAVVGGNAGKDVSAAITNLALNTTYHFRLVATNPSGSDQGADFTFTTGAPNGRALSIAANPTLLTFGATSTITGNLSGGQVSGVTVRLLQSPSPFTTPPANTGLTATTDANGAYSFSVTPPLTTRYQTVADTNPQTTSGTVDVAVRYRVTFGVSATRVRRGTRVRFKGTVSPAAFGRPVRIQRKTSSGFKTVARATLSSTSSYSKRFRIRRKGTYRVRISGDGAHLRGTSRTRTIRLR